MIRYLPALLLLVFLTSPSGSLARQASSEAETVADVAELRFAWPAETEIAVEVSSRQIREEPERDSDMLTEGSYTMRVREHPEGLLVIQDAFEATKLESTPALSEDDPVRLLYNEVGGVSPNYVVSPGGVLVRVDGIDEISNRAKQALEPVLATAPEQATGLRQMVDQMLSEQVLFSKIAEQWNALVGTWINADFEIGAEYVLEQGVPSPLLPGFHIPMFYVFSAVERTRCVAGGPEDGCVLLAMESFPDAEKLATALLEFVDRLAEGVAEPDLSFTRLNQENSIVLVTEPDTLLPHELEITSEVSGSVAENGQEMPFRRLEETRYQFLYE